MSKHIYVMSYIGGFSGEFISSQISQDPNYKNISYTVDESLHRYHLQDEIRDLKIANLRQAINADKFPYSDIQRNRIAAKINTVAGNQNYIIPSHNYVSDGYDFPIDPNRLKTVRLYSENFNFYFALGVLKTQMSQYPMDQYALLELEKRLLTTTDVSVIAQGRALIENIKEKGFYYHIERMAFRNRKFSIASALDAHYDRMNAINHSSLQPGYSNWNYFLNVDELYDNFSTARPIWKSIFNLEEDLNPAKFQEYYQKNIDLLENRTNKNLQTFLSGDIIGDLCELIRTEINSNSVLDHLSLI